MITHKAKKTETGEFMVIKSVPVEKPVRIIKVEVKQVEQPETKIIRVPVRYEKPEPRIIKITV